ncbi:hypothetical protein CDL15_Pgr011896 [Punica granatum]|uniref:Uncharacterized protein n=1 Tax=Punica granatum TaxID=22663 RepID=A0A218XMX3_PUNGR|nr:hypothetical protein CDL15_Pgr011896 [Punica granatum]
MAEGDHVDVSKEVNPSVRTLSLLQVYSRRISPPFQRISHPQRLRGRLCHRPHQLPPPPMTKPALRPSRARSTKWPPTWWSCSPCSEDLTGPPRAPHLRRDRGQQSIQPRGLHRPKPRRTLRLPHRQRCIHPRSAPSPVNFRRRRPPR